MDNFYAVNVTGTILHKDIDDPETWLREEFLIEEEGDCIIAHVLEHRLHIVAPVATPPPDRIYFNVGFFITYPGTAEEWVEKVLFGNLTNIEDYNIDINGFTGVSLLRKISQNIEDNKS